MLTEAGFAEGRIHGWTGYHTSSCTEGRSSRPGSCVLIERPASGGQPDEETAMGFYAQVIVPLLCDFGLDRPFVARYRRELLALAGGTILEIGFGTGLNLPCYPPHVRKVTTVDPNVGMYSRARRRLKQAGIEVGQRVLDGERLPFEDATFDCIVSTFTLCSIEQADQAVREVYRVLKPGGKFLFLEHGLGPELNVQKWQRRLNWRQVRLAGGCHVDRDMRALVTAPPFASVQMDEFYI
jgi:SAM-dependent methyltransferase